MRLHSHTQTTHRYDTHKYNGYMQALYLILYRKPATHKHAHSLMLLHSCTVCSHTHTHTLATHWPCTWTHTHRPPHNTETRVHAHAHTHIPMFTLKHSLHLHTRSQTRVSTNLTRHTLHVTFRCAAQKCHVSSQGAYSVCAYQVDPHTLQHSALIAASLPHTHTRARNATSCACCPCDPVPSTAPSHSVPGMASVPVRIYPGPTLGSGDLGHRPGAVGTVG